MSPVRTKYTPDVLERRALDALAGGPMMRTRLKLAVQSSMRARQFDRFIASLIARGLVAREQSMHSFPTFDGRRIERLCTVYRLVTIPQEKPS
jgi:hypothetical protein